MAAETRRSSMSLDVLGALGGSVRKLRSVIPSDMHVRHVEPIGIGPASFLRLHINQLADAGYLVSEIHGPTGSDGKRSFIDEARIRGMQTVFVSPKTLVGKFSDHELLIHTPVAAQQDVFRAFARKPPTYAWIENHNFGTKGVSEAASLVDRWRRAGIPTGLMYDVVHKIGPDALTSQREFPKAWTGMFHTMKRYSSLITGVHFPVGTFPADSLPMQWISDDMLKEFNNTLPRHVRTVVVENQQDGGRLLFLSRRAACDAQRRNGIIFHRLQKAEIVDFS